MIKYISEFGENVFSCDESVIFCNLCETKVSTLVWRGTQ